MFVDRDQELAFFNSLPTRTRPSTGQIILLYGRRRVGKTLLVRHWAETTGLPTIYWPAESEPAPLQRRQLFARMSRTNVSQTAAFESWTELWTAFASLAGDRRQILILDEIPYAAESDPAFLTSLQHAWDQYFMNSRTIIVLCGSHVHTMESLLSQGSPLFGRFTGVWHLLPLEFGMLRHFLPNWKAEQRIGAYSIVGGVPAYLAWLHPELTLSHNIRQVILSPGSTFMGESNFLLADQLKEPGRYQAVLKAIGAGLHTLDQIADFTLIAKPHLTPYLARLQELRFVRRLLPVTIPPQKQAVSRMGRYHFADPFLRFYFRFIEPQREDVGIKPDEVYANIYEQLRAYIGATAFEELCRAWLQQSSVAKMIPFKISHVGSHWSRGVQIDVVGINWREKSVLLGECKWETGRVERKVLSELIESKAPLALKTLPDEGQDWTVHYALFSRNGFSSALAARAKDHQVLLVDLDMLDEAFR
jgi:AAA+ ATPase superfamily predicted ATPase